ncbi:MAG: hypothetical protein AB2L11_10420 [Syntrophobacteraceae bacterium]
MMKQALCLWVIMALVIGSFTLSAKAGDDPGSSVQVIDPATGFSEICPPTESASVCPDPMEKQNPSGELILADSLILRPLGVVAMGVGFVGALLTLPWTAGSGSSERVTTELVDKPYEYTFCRPIGDVD